MNELRSFEPSYVPTVGSTAGTCPNSTTVAASNGVAVATSAAFFGTSNNNVYRQLRVANKTNQWVHINFGVQGSVTAATLNSQAFAPASIEVVTVAPEVTGASVFADGAPAGSTSVMFTRGQGTV